MRLTALLIAVVAMCAACVGSALRSSSDAPDRYRLDPPAAVPDGTTLPLSIVVARPRAPESLDTDRIAVTTPGHGFDYLAGARWADPAPQMLQRLLVDTLAGDGRFATALAAPSRVPADLLLDVEVRRFEATYADVDAAPTVVVELGLNLVDARRGARIASFASGASVAAARNGRGAVVTAFEHAVAQSVRDAATRTAAAAAAKP